MSIAFPSFKDLPDSLPIFPLEGLILLPNGELSLRVFEPGYLHMLDAALKEMRMIGMIQPRVGPASTDQGDYFDESKKTALFEMGCAGRITSFTETDDGTCNIGLTGLLRFKIKAELEIESGFRRVVPDFSNFHEDLEQVLNGLDDDHFGNTALSEDAIAIVTRYFERQKFDAELDGIRQAPLLHLVNTLAMSCPFSALEKQALLEASDLSQRLTMLLSLMEMASTQSSEGKTLN